MEETRCGLEPKFKKYTTDKDGFSLHAFEECFWANNCINLNGKLYIWKGSIYGVQYSQQLISRRLNLHKSLLS
jgi:hypothetical protein